MRGSLYVRFSKVPGSSGSARTQSITVCTTSEPPSITRNPVRPLKRSHSVARSFSSPLHSLHFSSARGVRVATASLSTGITGAREADGRRRGSGSGGLGPQPLLSREPSRRFHHSTFRCSRRPPHLDALPSIADIVRCPVRERDRAESTGAHLMSHPSVTAWYQFFGAGLRLLLLQQLPRRLWHMHYSIDSTPERPSGMTGDRFSSELLSFGRDAWRLLMDNSLS
jgi:hypothetical protein